MLAETYEIVLPAWCMWLAIVWMAKTLVVAFVTGVTGAIKETAKEK